MLGRLWLSFLSLSVVVSVRLLFVEVLLMKSELVGWFLVMVLKIVMVLLMVVGKG